MRSSKRRKGNSWSLSSEGTLRQAPPLEAPLHFNRITCTFGLRGSLFLHSKLSCSREGRLLQRALQDGEFCQMSSCQLRPITSLLCILTSSLALSFLFPTLSPPRAPCSLNHLLSPSPLLAPLTISSPALFFHHDNFKRRALSPTPAPHYSFQSSLSPISYPFLQFAPSNLHPPLSFPGSLGSSSEQVGHSQLHNSLQGYLPWILLFFRGVMS